MTIPVVRRVAALGLVLLTLATACSFRERRRVADHVLAAAERAGRAGAAAVVMAQVLRPIEVRRPDIQTHPYPLPIAGRLDIAGRRLAAGQLVFDGDFIYARKANPAPGERAWVRLDTSDLEDNGDPLIGFSVVNPALWVELIGGALTGSVKRMGAERVKGERFVRYKANLDYEKAFKDKFSDREFERLTDLFELMGMPSVVTPAQLWLDESGLPRLAVYEVEQRVDRYNAFELTVTLALNEWGSKSSFSRPRRDDTVDVEGLAQLLGESGVNQQVGSLPGQPFVSPPDGQPSS